MNIDKQVKEILEGLLRVIAGASQIAIDRGADSGTIDFKEPINQAQSQIHALYLEEFERMLPKKKEYGLGLYNLDDIRKQGFNVCLAEIKARLRDMEKTE